MVISLIAQRIRSKVDKSEFDNIVRLTVDKTHTKDLSIFEAEHLAVALGRVIEKAKELEKQDFEN